MKKFILTLVMAVVMTGVAFAQDGNNQRQRPTADQIAQRMTEQMVSRYGLNDTQKASLLALNKEYISKMPMRRGPRGGRPNGQRPDSAQRQRPSQEEMEQHRKEMQANQEAYNKAVKEILTADQYTQFTKDQQNMRQRRGPRQHDGGQQQAE